MAVSFKVPKSPKRNVFAIDSFLGVDLTNSGSSIDEVRSPNAENMVRYVPGKVRKRTGYVKDVLFGKDVNVNYVKGTSSIEKNFVFSSDDTGRWVKIYDVIEIIKSKDGNAYDLYYEFDYKSQATFWMSQNDFILPASEEWTHVSYIRHMNPNGQLQNVSLYSFAEQNIYIKNLSVMRGKDANYTWSPAPNYFVERANNDPVYGVHVGKTGTFEGNRVVNVNRALSTTDTFETYNVDTTWQQIKTLGEFAHPRVKLYFEFDYTSDADFMISVAGRYSTAEASSTTAHFSDYITVTEYYRNDVKLAVASGTATVNIKNLSVMYQVDKTTYDWTPAPEDNQEKFPIEDIYLVGSKNYALNTSFDSQDLASSSTHELDKRFEIEDASSKVEGYARISFNLHTASYNTDLAKVEVWVVNNQSQGTKISESTEHYKSELIECYIPAGALATDYITHIGIVYKFNTGNGACWTYISNLQVNEITPRSSYDISPKWYIYHVGTDFYLRASNSKDFTKVYSNANQHLSKSWQFNKSLYILDGKDIYAYAIGDETVTPIGEENGYIPTVTIAKEMHGGGVPYEPLNMLQPAFIETFQGIADWRMCYLSFRNLDSTPVRAWVMNSVGGWDEKFEGTDFTVNRGIGMVDFVDPPGVSPITGEDNIKIQAYRTVPGYKERVTKCTNGTLFGVGGAEDRLFLTGNPDYPNWDFYSEQYDPTYFPDTGYSALGSEQSAIVGYALVNNYLAAFKDGFDESQSVFIREGDLVVTQHTYAGGESYETSDPAFKLINTLQGNGVVAPYAFGYLTTEPLFLTKSGIYAITAQDITGEKYSQNRSFYLNGALTKESGLENAVATTFNDMYVLAVNNQLYILDGLQATRTDKSEPYATRQYVGFHCKDVPAICLWTDNDSLWFGTGDGKVCFFNNDIEALESYNDDGEPIYCCWETPDLDGKLFYKNKTFRYFAIRMMKVLRTSVALWSEKLGAWTFIKEDKTAGLTFDFENIDFEAFSFSTDRSEKVVHTKVRVKKVDKARFRVENGKINEPFGLIDLALEYVESGNYKG